MTCRFKPLPELYWGVLVAVATVLLLELVGLNPDAITDWRGWAVALGAAAVRAGAGAALDYVRRSIAQPEPMPPTLLDQIMALPADERARLGAEVERRGTSQGEPPPVRRITVNDAQDFYRGLRGS